MTQHFHEIEKIQKRKIWLLFGCIFSTYTLTVSLFLWGWFFIGIPFIIPITLNVFLSDFSLTIAILLFLTGIFLWYFSLHKDIFKVLVKLKAYPPDKNDSYHLVYENLATEISLAFGETNLEIFVYNSSGVNSLSIYDLGGKGAILFSEGALSLLSRDQLQALVAQSIARCATREAMLTTITYFIGERYQEKLAELQESLKKLPSVARGLDQLVVGTLLILFGIAILNLLTWIFSFFKLFLSRENGLKADATAVSWTRNPLALAEAFYISGHSWRGLQPKKDLAPLFSLQCEEKYNTLQGERIPWLAQLFETHPPFLKRIQILLDMVHSDFFPLKQALKKQGQQPCILSREKKQIAIPQIPFMKNTGVRNLLNPIKKQNVTSLEKKHLCPSCKTICGFVQKVGVLVKQCKQCKGFLIKVPLMNRILTRREKIFNPKVVEMASLVHNFSLKKKVNFSFLFKLHKKFQYFLENETLTVNLRKEFKKNNISLFPNAQIVLLQKNQRWRIDNQNNSYLISKKMIALEVYKDFSFIQRGQLNLGLNERGSLHCPHCHNRMISKPYSLILPIAVDLCRICQLIWFDPLELEIIQYLMWQHRRKKFIHD